MKKPWFKDIHLPSFGFQKKSLIGNNAIESLSKSYLHQTREKARVVREEEQRKAEAEKQRKLIAGALNKKSLESTKPVKEEKPEPALPKRQKAKRKRRSFKQILILAGVETDLTIITRKLFIYSIITTFILTAITLVIGFAFNSTFRTYQGLLSYLGFAVALWTVVFAAVFLLYASCYAIYLDLRINKRRKEIEAVFPDYLQLAAANLSAGMTIDQALYSAVRPRFGVLAKEIEDVAKKTMTGYDLERALTEFSDKYDSMVLKRSINLIAAGIRSGGRMADILNKIAINIQENAILQKEMAANVTTYVIFISFASILAAPFLFALATQLLLVIQKIAGSIATQGGSGFGLSINPNVVKLSDFKLFSMTVLSATSLMSACIVSVIRKGTVKDGLRLLPFFLATTLTIYFVAVWGLGYIFSGLI